MQVIDSHTGGEPTRVILDGGPDLGSGSLVDRAARLAKEHRAFYRSVLLEPRGQPAMVGALLVKPVDSSCVAGVIYFDVGAVLGMCGHGTIGLAVTLAHLGRIGMGTHKIETPAGIVEIELVDANTVTVTNIESRRLHTDVCVHIDDFGSVRGDIAYGGNCFFIVDPSPLHVEAGNIGRLTELAQSLRSALLATEVGANVDHIILHGPSDTPGVHSRNFVLCPDDAYDRSPCGTGSSARLACLAADGQLQPGEEIINESIIGSTYRISYRESGNGGVIPTIRGQAFVTAESKLIFNEADPFRDGIEF